jgi:predicted GNAT superfamily acetyltransferase
MPSTNRIARAEPHQETGTRMSEAIASPARQDFHIQPLLAAEDMQACVELQNRVWGYMPIDTVPEQIFIVAAKTGGHVLLARDNDAPIGFALAFAAVRAGRVYLHSHMVAVLDEYQNRGVGRLLKLAQRDDALNRGFDLIEWTFDPLQLKNARFNIARLGAIVRHYVPNLYGQTSSPLHAGLPTDRLVAEWWVRSPRVAGILNGGVPAQTEKEAPPTLRADRVCVSIPANIRELCRDEPRLAEKIQSRIRQEFSTHFAHGRAVVAFQINEERGAYLLEPYED